MRIHADHQPSRKKPYVARWYEGTRQSNKFFASATARDEFIEQLQQTARRQDPTLPALAPHQLIRFQQAVAIDPEADPVEVFQFWKAEKAKIRKALGNSEVEFGNRLYPLMGWEIPVQENIGQFCLFSGRKKPD